MASNGNINCTTNDVVWQFKGNGATSDAAAVTLKKLVFGMFKHCNFNNGKTILPCLTNSFKTCPEAEEAVAAAVRSGMANSYAPSPGTSNARRAVVDYLNGELPTKLRPEDVYITGGCNQAIEILIDSLAGNPAANILLPNPVYPHYDARAMYSGVEVRKYDLLPERDFEIDLDALEAAADKNTVALVLVNPNNPCGNVYTYDHLKKVAEMARKLGILVISDEVYDQVVYGDRPFVPMGIFASIAPVITLGSISKGWVVPGWRIGWMAINDSNSILKQAGVLQSIEDCLELTPQPSFILQEALPEILEKTPKEYFVKKNKAMKRNVELSFERLRDIPCLFCPKKPESCSYLWLRLDTSVLDNIENDLEFCTKLASEESLILVPGVAFGSNNWVRISIGTEESELEETYDRLKSFYGRHAISKESIKPNGHKTVVNQRVVSVI
ncbi:putative aminotransferase TAT3 [Raphanus sativus]|uniref:Probable aminotransferase TAT3 n=1 Tax=Raphanus sativus TaxID=3726 RepID=A0A6J0NHT8_RAPSA|nr:probable aminotransferase TAT3 [Raphanus sativus]KAJ4900098.1 putative aminotransferase TAT3 [Raphanus sativus]